MAFALLAGMKIIYLSQSGVKINPALLQHNFFNASKEYSCVSSTIMFLSTEKSFYPKFTQDQRILLLRGAKMHRSLTPNLKVMGTQNIARGLMFDKIA